MQICLLQGTSVPAPLLVQLRGWFEDQWGRIDSFEGNHPEVLVPSPIVAVDENRSLLGGLAFSTFLNPQNNEVAVWINAVLVSPQQRSKGIASRLIRSAEEEAELMAIPQLFVLSEFPGLYQKLGWQVLGLDDSPGETTLKKVLARR